MNYIRLLFKLSVHQHHQPIVLLVPLFRYSDSTLDILVVLLQSWISPACLCRVATIIRTTRRWAPYSTTMRIYLRIYGGTCGCLLIWPEVAAGRKKFCSPRSPGGHDVLYPRAMFVVDIFHGVVCVTTMIRRVGQVPDSPELVQHDGSWS